MAAFPSAIANLTNPTGSNNLSDATVLHSLQHGNANDEIEAIETELGINPSGSWATIVARLAGIDYGIINVKDPTYGATGDGVTDDTAALNAAFAAVPANGGIVYFPAGIYLVSSQLNVKSYTTIVGSQHASRYWGYSSTNPPVTCAIKVKTGFSNASLFPFPSGFTSASLEDIVLLGNNIGTVNGIEFPAGTIEQVFCANNFAIIGFGGDGIKGRCFVDRFNNFFIGGNRGWGINATINMSDSHFLNGYVSGNKLGGVNLSGSAQSGADMFTNVRFERSGWDSAAPSTPVATTSPGVKIGYANNCTFVACTTDANSGHGLDVSLTRDNAGDVYDIAFVGCHIRRDGFGTMAALGEFAAVKVQGWVAGAAAISYIALTDCHITTGKAKDDGTAPAYLHPKYGLWWEKTTWCSFLAGRVEGTVQYYGGPSGTFAAKNWRPNIQTFDDRIHAWPVDTTANRPAAPGTGWAMFDSTIGLPIWWNGSNWKNAAGTTV